MKNGLKTIALGLAFIAPLSFAGSGTTAEHIEAATSCLQKIGKGKQLPVDGYRQGY